MTNNQNINGESSAVQTHLKMMQGVIQRMAENSRFCKVWCVTLVAATLIWVARTEEPRHALIALVPTALFWILDAYYLALERAFRTSYGLFVDKLHKSDLAFNEVYVIKRSPISLGSLMKCLISSSTIPFYMLFAITILLAWMLIV